MASTIHFLATEEKQKLRLPSIQSANYSTFVIKKKQKQKQNKNQNQQTEQL